MKRGLTQRSASAITPALKRSEMADLEDDARGLGLFDQCPRDSS